MARTLSFPYKRGEVINTSPANITFDEEQNGRAFLYQSGDFSDLLEDLRGGRPIHTPIWCEPIALDNGNGLKLVAGQRRLLAGLEYLKENPEYLIKVLVVEPKDELEALEMNAKENSGRKDLSIIDHGHIAIRLREEPTKTGGRTLDQIAKVLNISQAQVTQAIKIVEGLPNVVQRLIHTGKVTIDAALTTLKVADPEKRKGMIEEFLSGKPTPVSVPEQPIGQAERPIPTVAEVVQEERPERNVREVARESGAKIALRMPEFKKYLQEAIDEDGPGSNKGEVLLKKKILEFLEGKLTAKTMDKHFNEQCKMKG